VELVAVKTVKDKERGLLQRVKLQLVVAARIFVAPTSGPYHAVISNFGVSFHVPVFSVDLRIHSYTRHPLLLHVFESLFEVDSRALVEIGQLSRMAVSV